MPQFIHSFDPVSLNPGGSVVDLSVREIEDAGLLEILQTPGAALGTWSLFDALLETGNSSFVFKEPLGKSREVKVALSGLFGRFVARAYAKRYLGFSHFQHIHSPPMRLSGAVSGVIARVGKGDMPDWVVWGPASGLGIIEAKGSHHPQGPAEALSRAYAQAERAEILVGSRPATFKRFAIATRWGFSSPIGTMPHLSVRDPVVEGEDVTPEELDQVGLGIARRHYASLLRPLGHPELAASLSRLAAAATAARQGAEQQRARSALDGAGATKSLSAAPVPGELVGGFVTKGGPLASGAELSRDDAATLAGLNLAPSFVGVERAAIKAAIEGNTAELRNYLKDSKEAGGVSAGADARSDSAGTRIIRLGSEASQT